MWPPTKSKRSNCSERDIRTITKIAKEARILTKNHMMDQSMLLPKEISYDTIGNEVSYIS